MKTKRQFTLILLLIIATLGLNVFDAGAEEKNIIYVKKEAAATDAENWVGAYQELAEALTNATSGDEIWVAKGMYMPTTLLTPGDDNSATFTIPAGVAVYGGFDGTETERNQRNWAANTTILSGDLGRDDHPDVIHGLSKENNCYRVVFLTGGTLDGFTVTGGYGEGSGGTGVYANSGIIRNNTITGNRSTSLDGFVSYGGGVRAEGSAQVINNTIYDNNALYGGGVHAEGSAQVTGNIITGNGAGYGGGVYAEGNAQVVGNTITGNRANEGDGVWVKENALLTHNIIWGNSGGQDLYAHNVFKGDITYNLIGTANVDLTANGNLTAEASATLFINADYADYRLQTGSLAYDEDGSYIGAWPYLIGNEDGIVYVDASVDTSVDGYIPDGSSWANALTRLSDALVSDADDAKTRNIKKVYVAKGTYKQRTSNRRASFTIPEGVAVYGGFPAGDSKMEDRDWVANTTILSGDLNEDDIPGKLEKNKSDNSRTVVTLTGGTLDGFTVTGGGGNENGYGSGVYATGGIIQNNTIIHNITEVDAGCGGGVYAEGKTLVTGNTITGNMTNISGGGVYASGEAQVIGNTITGNTAGGGGGVWAEGTAQVVGNTITGNTAGSGGGVYVTGEAQVLSNTIIDNTGDYGGGVCANDDAHVVSNTIIDNTGDYGVGVYAHSNAQVINNIIWGNELCFYNEVRYTGSIRYNLMEKVVVFSGNDEEWNPIIEDVDLTNNKYSNITNNLTGNAPIFVNPEEGDYSLDPDSPGVNAGSNAAFLTAMHIVDFNDDILDAAGNPRLYGETIDMGAYECQSDPTPATFYHTLTLEVAPGIDLYNYTAGTHQIADGDHLHLQFLADDRTVTADQLILLIDGIDTPFEIPAGTDTYFSYILNPITADHTVLIALREYTVTLPPTEGITYNVGAGEHTVPYGAPFSFTLSGDFDSELLKVYINGIEIQSEGASQTYTIPQVMGPITITIEGYITSNASLAHGIRLAITNCELRITNEMPNAVDVSIYTLTGQTFAQLRALRGSRTITLPAGVYIVRAGEQRWKVIVND